MLNFLFEKNISRNYSYPDRRQSGKWLEDLYDWYFGVSLKEQTYKAFQYEFQRLKRELKELLTHCNERRDQNHLLAEDLMEKILECHHIINADLNATLENDPAAKSEAEVILSYPGFFALFVHRIAHFLYQEKVPVLDRIFSEYAHSRTGIDIHPGAQIGQGVYIDHGTGIVIGETTIIGNKVRIFQGVTLGALTVSKNKAEIKRHPTIEDEVVIYANATILGGKTLIGKGSVIGGNVWLVESVPARSLVYHQPEIKVRDQVNDSQIIDFSI